MRLRYLLPLLAPLLMATGVGTWHQHFDATNADAPSDTIDVDVRYDVTSPDSGISTCAGQGTPTWTDHASITLSGGETLITYTSIINGTQIIYHLDGDERANCFHYANGDVGCTGAVTLNRIEPDHSATCATAVAGSDDCLHGWMLNPSDDGNYALDSRATFTASHGWEAAQLGVAGSPTFPKVIAAGSILKAVSYPVGQTSDAGNAVCTSDAHSTCLKYVAALSIVPSAPANPAGTFRPPVYGTTKPTDRLVSNVQWSKLGTLSSSGNGISMTSAPSFTALRRRFLEYQIEISDHIDQQRIHASGNFDFSGYHGELSGDIASAISRLTIDDFSTTNRTACEAAVSVIQYGIDFWWQHEKGWAFNDHSHGRQMVYAFAAYMLNDAQMKAKFASVSTLGVEEINRYNYRASDGSYLWGHTCTPIQFWQRFWDKSKTPKDCGDPHGKIDGEDVYWYCCNYQQDKAGIAAFEQIGVTSLYESHNLMIGWIEANYRRYTSGVKKLPDSCATYDGNQSHYGVTFGPPGGSAPAGCELTGTCPCIAGSHPPTRDNREYDPDGSGPLPYGWYPLADGERQNSGITQGEKWSTWNSEYVDVWTCARNGTCVTVP